MANEHWYVLRVRARFESNVEKELRELLFDAVIPDQKSIDTQDSQIQQARFTGSTYYQFRLVDCESVSDENV
jgi:hypothetical protein